MTDDEIDAILEVAGDEAKTGIIGDPEQSISDEQKTRYGRVLGTMLKHLPEILAILDEP